MIVAVFTLTVEPTPNTCENSEITIHKEPDDVEYLIGSGLFQMQYEESTDSSYSVNLPDGLQTSSCGLYSIISSESWLVPYLDSTDSSKVQLTIDVDDENLAGTYDLILTIGL